MMNTTGLSVALTRRQALIGGSAAAAAALAPSCGFAGSQDDLHITVADRVRALTRAQPTRLRLLLPNGSGGNLRPLIKAFKTMTGVDVLATEAPVDEINTILSLDALSNTESYDVALPATFALPDLVTSGALLPLNAYAQTYEPDGFREGILYSIGDHFDGKLYGFQTDGDAYLMFYNTDMLHNPDEQARYADTYGTPLARPNVWSELDRQMAFFHRPDEGQYGGMLLRAPGYLGWEWWVRFHAKGVWPFSPTMDPQIATDAGREALEDMIRSSEHMAPGATELGLFENWDRFSKGGIYSTIGWGGSQKYFNRPESAVRNKLAFGRTPGGMNRGQLLRTPYFNWGWNYVVVRHTPAPEIAYLFALFASSPRMSTLAVAQVDGFFDPFRPEHYRDEGIKSAYSEAFLKVHRKSLTSAIPDLYLEGQSEYFRVLEEWLKRALLGEVTVETALSRVTSRWQLITNGIGRQAQSRRWNELRAKYPPQVRRLMHDPSA